MSGTGPWDPAGDGLVPVRGVEGHDRSGTHRDQSVFRTDAGVTARPIIATDPGRWTIETLVEELRESLALER